MAGSPGGKGDDFGLRMDGLILQGQNRRFSRIEQMTQILVHPSGVVKQEEGSPTPQAGWPGLICAAEPSCRTIFDADQAGFIFIALALVNRQAYGLCG
ncbi:MAG: hypothetical protein C4524_14790 [Candidatus Zixiibacteriota bacterium]|nr:MAG: hypothetical protein C4524_14790 [candidate division Zixibacteria bacterium]